jgi:hypothetical protein
MFGSLAGGHSNGRCHIKPAKPATIRHSSRLAVKAARDSKPAARDNSSNRLCAWNTAFQFLAGFPDFKDTLMQTSIVGNPVTSMMQVRCKLQLQACISRQTEQNSERVCFQGIIRRMDFASRSGVVENFQLLVSQLAAKFNMDTDKQQDASDIIYHIMDVLCEENPRLANCTEKLCFACTTA